MALKNSSMKLDAETIGRLCMETECGDGIPPNDLVAALFLLPAAPGRDLSQMARICGELYEEMEAARDECDAVAQWLEEFADTEQDDVLEKMLADFKNRFPREGGVAP